MRTGDATEMYWSSSGKRFAFSLMGVRVERSLSVSSNSTVSQRALQRHAAAFGKPRCVVSNRAPSKPETVERRRDVVNARRIRRRQMIELECATLKAIFTLLRLEALRRPWTTCSILRGRKFRAGVSSTAPAACRCSA